MLLKEFKKLKEDVKKGRIVPIVIGNALYLSDPKEGIDYRIGNVLRRTPVQMVCNDRQVNGKSYCPVCGTELAGKPKFCSECGLQINYESPFDDSGQP